MRLRGRVFAAVTMAAALVGVAVGGPAHAADTSKDTVWVKVTGSKVNNGSLHFVDKGDRFVLADLAADGYGVKAFVYRGSTVVKKVYHGGGADTKTEFAYDLKTGNKYAMKVCAVDGPLQKVIGCSGSLSLAE